MSEYAALHRLAAREALRVELGQKINEIEAAKFAAVYTPDNVVHCYGSRKLCEQFAEGLRHMKIVPMTVEMKNVQTTHKVQVYRSQGA